MANEKQILSRLQQKTDISTSWQKAGNNGFVPRDGEIIVYKDLNKIKIGNGVNNVNDLDFITGNSGVLSIATGSSNGTISVNTNGSSTDVAVKGLGSAAYTASTAYDPAGTAQAKADAALASAKSYADGIKNDLLNGAGGAYDTLKELGDLIDDNQDAISALETALDGKADKSEGAFYIEGSGSTDDTAKTSTWIGTSDRITKYYDGLTIRYKIGVAGQTTVTLNINGLGAKTVYRFNTTKLSTQFPVGSIIHLVYHTDLNNGCWITNDYDANTDTYQRVYESSSKNVEYPITARYNTTTGSSYYAEYGRYSTGVTLNPSTKTITATAFKGKLTGNADTATKATQDASGNVITSTYATKTELGDISTALTNIISQTNSIIGGS